MSETTTILLSLQSLLTRPVFRQLTLICEAMLMMQGRVTMLGISRWTHNGGSYRTIQRFFLTQLNWGILNSTLVKAQLRHCEGVVLIAGDATTVTKSGKKTFGLGRFFSSICSRTIPSIAFQTLSLIDVERRRSWPLLVEQIAPKPAQAKVPATPPKATRRGRGRPKGSKNKNHREVELNDEMIQVKSMLTKMQMMISDTLKPAYFVYDGAFGNNAAVQMTRSVGLHLISKLRNDSALCFEWDGVYSGKGRPPLYGGRVNYSELSDNHLKSTENEKGVCTRIYQFKGVHKKFSDTLNILLIIKHNEKTGKSARVILFSTGMKLCWEELLDYYKLRFQIEFNFRDAKQHWGLEDFMVIKERAVTNAANLSFFMVNLSQAMMAATGTEDASILDLKARFHGLRYAQETFKMLPENARVFCF